MKCAKRISYGGGFHFSRCSRDAVNGMFCRMHDPERPDKVRRREEARRKFDARVQSAVNASEATTLREQNVALAEKCKRLEGLLRRAAECVGVETWSAKDAAEDAVLLEEIRRTLAEVKR
jgi:hypothetical protein